jgi:rSAM/selenodomain-associated transferase 2/rSAM/selenodomain-associated transferase 1
MRGDSSIAVIIPALNEEEAIGKVVSGIPAWVDDIIVVDNGSTDRTVEAARSHGARTVTEPERGYGSACLAGIAALQSPAVVVFLDGDFSDRPEEMHALVDPILQREADLVIGSRVLGTREHGALTPQARFGNWLACHLIRLIWKAHYTDLGPFRAIRFSAFRNLGMRDRGYGWTVEMQIKAARSRLRVLEVPVSYRRRIGKSKISGTVKGVIGAGTKILATILGSAFSRGLERELPREALILFTRHPEPGKTKTRLIPILGEDGAAELQRRMTVHALIQVRRLARLRRASPIVCYEGADHPTMTSWLGPDLQYCPQCAGDLGERMANSFQHVFQQGIDRAVLVGTDCPGVNPDLFQKALDSLRQNDLVLGPAEDGGYYLVGLASPQPDLFAGVPWGTDAVLETTLHIALRLGLKVSLVDRLGDVDRPEDLHIWDQGPGRPTDPGIPPRLSVIIPAFHEAELIASVLAAVSGIPEAEVIVVDGGSTDGTPELAAAYGAKVFSTNRDRAKQMNLGALKARGKVLLFLHADTHLPQGFEKHVLASISEPGAVGGAFELRIDACARGLRFIERMANWRSRRLQLPYGDQALFVKADVFRELGGFPDLPIMEDYELVRRLKRTGRIVILPIAAATSARRWLRLGVWRTTLVNQLIILGYHLGVSPQLLSRFYRGSSKVNPVTPGR